MAEIWQIIIKTNTLNFILVLLLLIFLISKLNIKQKIENARNDIKNYVEESENEKQKAKEALQNIENQIKNLPAELDDIKKSTANSVKSIEEKIKNDLVSQKQDIENNAARLFNLETRKFKENLKNLLSLKSIEIAQNNALKQLSADKNLHSKYIDSAIAEIDRIEL